MSKGAQLSDEKYIAFACVRFKDQSKEEYSIVPVDYVKQKFGKILKDFQPSDENDFIRNEFYYALWKCPDSCAEDHEHKSFYKANILHLGGKYIYIMIITSLLNNPTFSQSRRVFLACGGSPLEELL